jgi:hypothetical protein
MQQLRRISEVSAITLLALENISHAIILPSTAISHISSFHFHAIPTSDMQMACGLLHVTHAHAHP